MVGWTELGWDGMGWDEGGRRVEKRDLRRV
jgi:hypothetical protein